MPVKTFREGAAGEPSFPDNFEVVKNAVLQVTDIKTNRNKYYAIELHSAKNKYRVYTHYGRTDDLESNPDAGVRECRYFASLAEADKTYDKIYKQKTSARKGYKEVNLASSKIGSAKVRGKSSGFVDEATIKKMKGDEKKKPKKKKAESFPELNQHLQSFVGLIYSEATNALVKTVNASVTANGIETPLGVLTMGQIDKGQEILDEILVYAQKKKTKGVKEKITNLSGEFYTVIPHRIGRNRAVAQSAIIDTIDDFNAKQDTLQLMRDMLSVSSGDDAADVFVSDEIGKKYKALGCKMNFLGSSSSDFKEIKDYVESNQIKTKNIRVKNVIRVSRQEEEKAFVDDMKNQKMLFHGSSAKNWVGILSRGLLLPKTVVKLGVQRTDGGWLGHGIYFGNVSCTARFYASPTKKGTYLMTVAKVALGKVKKYSRITYGLNSPPAGFDSCHGVRGTQFSDDEFVIYEQNQQKLQYVVEFTG